MNNWPEVSQQPTDWVVIGTEVRYIGDEHQLSIIDIECPNSVQVIMNTAGTVCNEQTYSQSYGCYTSCVQFEDNVWHIPCYLLSAVNKRQLKDIVGLM